ncbi:MAG: ATP-dependent DNA ligase [Chloroflexota bacterium]|nr:ATP-dependent DNA ligase [Chloroflexota bacterium]
MAYPIEPPIPPMLAKPTPSIPTGEGWIYEPKWDGFRALVFRDGSDVYVQSRDLKPLNRYFPEIEEPLRSVGGPGSRFVLDGEVVIARPDGALDFDALLLRIHPAASRVKMLSEESPASFVAFDCLADEADDLRDTPFSERRARLERLLARPPESVRLTPSTTDPAMARHWFDVFEGAGLDGVIGKRAADAYAPGKRTMAKIKHARTADCVVAGFRWHKNGPGTLIGSLMLGLFNDAGFLQSVGVTSSFTMARRSELVEFLDPYRSGVEDHPWRDWAIAEAAAVEQGRRLPGAQSRWNRGKDLSWEPVRPELVCEVAFDHLQNDRFRHATTFVRWRPDRSPDECRYDQLEETPPALLNDLFGAPSEPAPPPFNL